MENLNKPTPLSVDIKETQNILKEGETKVILRDEYTIITLVLGNTGAGKSTFLLWFAGDNGKLNSTRLSNGEYLITDGNDKISKETITSKTIFPELVVDAETNNAYYDCPGFLDTRSTSHDVAATYFVKKVADHAKRIKLVIVVSYHSVRKGVDRNDFMLLIKQCTALIKDVTKFYNSIALIVTKVENSSEEDEDGRLNYISDEMIIEGIADFLQEVKEQLVKKSSQSPQSIDLIDTLLIKNNNKYARIGIFRRPNKPGPLSKIILLKKGKEHIRNILNTETQFTAKDDNDFGYTISDNSKLAITGLVTGINDNVESNLKIVIQSMTEHFVTLVQQLNDAIMGCSNNPHRKQEESETLLSKLNSGYGITLKMAAEIGNIGDISELAETVNISLTSLGMNTNGHNIQNIATQGKYLKFFQTVNDKKLDIRPWGHFFHDVKQYLENSVKNTEDNIKRTLENITNAVNLNINNIVTELKEHYLSKLQTLEIEHLPNELYNGQHAVLNIVSELEKKNNMIGVSQIISHQMQQLDISSSAIKTSAENITQQEDRFICLNHLKNGQLHIWSSSWVTPFNELATYLESGIKLNKFLKSLYDKFSEFKIQGNTRKYNVANINNWGDASKPQGIMITRQNYNEFLEKIQQYNIEEYDSVCETENVEEQHLQDINEVLSLTVKGTVNVVCDSGKLLITGDYIKVSDFTDFDGKLKRFCESGEKLKSVEVFAMKTIFIDIDFHGVGDKLQFTMIAPRWEIIGNRKINLDGSPGEAQVRAADNYYFGGRGIDGMPGLPGGSAGNFLGIGKDFINSENLTITANGGQGGPGQDGQNGVDGNKGETPKYDSNHGYDNYEMRKMRDDKIITVVVNQRHDRYQVYGTHGGSGGNGGNGGVKGLGGRNGEIKILQLNESIDKQWVIEHPSSGAVGVAGKGGKGGKGGQNGDTIEVIWALEMFLFIPVKQSWKETVLKQYPDSKTWISGNDGIDDYNKRDQLKPEPKVEFQNFYDALSRYKIHLQQNSNNRFKRNFLISFDNLLNNNPNIRNSRVRRSLELVNELQNLEEQSYNLDPISQNNIMYFYQSILNRASDYAQHPSATEITNEHKKLLSYIHTSIISKIYDSKYNSQSNLIVDLSEYIDLTKKNIQNLQEKINKIVVLENYKSSIDQNIAEANTFIGKQILPEMDYINTQIDNKIDLLIQETLALDKQAREGREILLEKEKELKQNFILKAMSNIVGTILGVLGPAGEFISSSIGVATTVSDSLQLDDNDHPHVPLPSGIVSHIRKLERNIESVNDVQFSKLLDFVYQESNKHPESLHDISVIASNMKIKYQFAKRESDFNLLKEMKEELKRELDKKELNLKTKNTNEIDANALATITKFKRAVQFLPIGFDVYNKYKNNEEKLNTIAEAIEDMENKIQLLEQYEETIHNVISPMLKDMKAYLNNTASELNNKSHVFLDITKWKVQGSLRDMKLLTQQLTAGFTVEGDLLRCVEKSEEAMTTLINLYDRIQNYQEQKTLADYIADISSVAANNIKITDPELSNALNYLDATIRSNIIRQQYDSVVNAVKQQVFPLAFVYLDETMLPSHFKPEPNIADSVAKLAQHIDTIKSKMVEHKATIKYHDKYLQYGWFNSKCVSTEPFFVWENRNHRETISRLLSGREVVVKADVALSSPNKEAVKFSSIEINFKSSNNSIQPQVDETLKGFKVSLVHLGNSYFRYHDKFYVISSEKQSILYSFEKDNDGEPIHKNKVYEKIKSGDIMLSPYAMWEIQLINATSGIGYRELDQYKNGLDLELIGYGSYLDKRTNMPKFNITDYYKEDKTIQTKVQTRMKRSQLTWYPAEEAPPLVASCASRHSSFFGHLKKMFLSFFNGQEQVGSDVINTEPNGSTHQISSPYTEYTAGHFQGFLQLMDLAVRKWTGQKYAPPSMMTTSPSLAEVSVQSIEYVEAFKQNLHKALTAAGVAFDPEELNEFDCYQQLVAGKSTQLDSIVQNFCADMSPKQMEIFIIHYNNPPAAVTHLLQQQSGASNGYGSLNPMTAVAMNPLQFSQLSPYPTGYQLTATDNPSEAFE